MPEVIDVDAIPDDPNPPSDDSEVIFTGFRRDAFKSKLHSDQLDTDGVTYIGFKESPLLPVWKNSRRGTPSVPTVAASVPPVSSSLCERHYTSESPTIRYRPMLALVPRNARRPLRKTDLQSSATNHPPNPRQLTPALNDPTLRCSPVHASMRTLYLSVTPNPSMCRTRTGAVRTSGLRRYVRRDSSTA